MSRDTGVPQIKVTKCQTATPAAMAEKWPRMTDRGAAARENGLLNSINALGPSAGKSNGKSISRASALMIKIAIPPLAAATSEMSLRSSLAASKDGMDQRARQINRRRLKDSVRVIPNIQVSSTYHLPVRMHPAQVIGFSRRSLATMRELPIRDLRGKGGLAPTVCPIAGKSYASGMIAEIATSWSRTASKGGSAKKPAYSG